MVSTTAVRTARLLALANVEGVDTALAEIVPDPSGRYEIALRADLLARTGDSTRAAALFRRAAEIAENSTERRHLLRRAEDTGRP